MKSPRYFSRLLLFAVAILLCLASYGSDAMVTRTAAAGAPTPPTNLHFVSILVTGVCFAWDGNPNADGFHIYLSTGETATFSSGVSNQGIGDGITPQSCWWRLKQNSQVCISMSAYTKTGGDSARAGDICFDTKSTLVRSRTDPVTPTNLRATKTTADTICVAWDEPDNVTDGFIVKWPSGDARGMVPPNSPAYCTTKLPPNHNECYVVAAYNEYGVAADSPSLCAATSDAAAPVAPVTTVPDASSAPAPVAPVTTTTDTGSPPPAPQPARPAVFSPPAPPAPPPPEVVDPTR